MHTWPPCVCPADHLDTVGRHGVQQAQVGRVGHADLRRRGGTRDGAVVVALVASIARATEAEPLTGNLQFGRALLRYTQPNPSKDSRNSPVGMGGGSAFAAPPEWRAQVADGQLERRLVEVIRAEHEHPGDVAEASERFDQRLNGVR